MFLSCVIRMITKRSKNSSYQNEDNDALHTPLLKECDDEADEIDAKLIDEDEIAKSIGDEANNNEVDAKLIDIEESENDNEVDVKLIDV